MFLEIDVQMFYKFREDLTLRVRLEIRRYSEQPACL